MFLFGLSVFQYHCVCVDASISNQFWNTDPHLAVAQAHYRRPIGLSKAPRLGSLKEGSLTLCLDTSWKVLRLPIVPVCSYFIQFSTLKVVRIQRLKLTSRKRPFLLVTYI